MSESEIPKPSSSQLALYVGPLQQATSTATPPPPPPLQQQHYQHHQHPHPASSSLVHHQQQQLRDYRKGNWTVQETLTLITAKRLDDERRCRGGGGVGVSSSMGSSPRSAEQRWKWVENFCWKNDCLRSQNQCNDKWDNLLRDYKKVRDYESRNNREKTTQLEMEMEIQKEEEKEKDKPPPPPPPSYWSMERHERKQGNLPTNLSSEVYQALTDVLSRRNARRNSASSSSSPAAVAAVSVLPSLPLLPPPPPPPPPSSSSLPPSKSASFGSETSGSDEEDEDEPEPKRRRVRSLRSSVARSASELARTLLHCEEKREQRHRELLQIEERRLKMEEDRTDMNRQALCGLMSAVDSLSTAINALVSRTSPSS